MGVEFLVFETGFDSWRFQVFSCSAQVLAAGGTVESEEAVREHVPRGSFLEEAQQLLDGALARSEELRTVLDSRCDPAAARVWWLWELRRVCD